ncbi:2'-5' RNA ligase family protein [Nonomuraea bangladeshensis]|uniref:2'-5' RNA ligase family protein n=1 Tax=Nonomuraea bangladeshensis TaxID=404385 RepID=UPI003C2AFE68
MHHTTIEHVPEVRNHWWWRPGWREGRHYYACHLSFEGRPELYTLVDRYQEALKTFPVLDLIPRPWLHLTMQGIGFTDEINKEAMAKIEDALRSNLRRMTPPVVTFHRPVIVPEAIYLPASPATQVQDLRTACRAAITTVQAVDTDPRPYRPHVSIAYVNAASSSEHIAQDLDMVDVDPVEVRISHVSLMVFHRDRRMYEWTTETRIPIGNSPA